MSLNKFVTLLSAKVLTTLQVRENCHGAEKSLSWSGIKQCQLSYLSS